MKHGHQNHTYPANKMIPLEISRWIKEKCKGRGSKSVTIANRFAKRFHTKKSRSYNKELCRKAIAGLAQG